MGKKKTIKFSDKKVFNKENQFADQKSVEEYFDRLLGKQSRSQVTCEDSHIDIPSFIMSEMAAQQAEVVGKIKSDQGNTMEESLEEPEVSSPSIRGTLENITRIEFEVRNQKIFLRTPFREFSTGIPVNTAITDTSDYQFNIELNMLLHEMLYQIIKACMIPDFIGTIIDLKNRITDRFGQCIPLFSGQNYALLKRRNFFFTFYTIEDIDFVEDTQIDGYYVPNSVYTSFEESLKALYNLGISANLVLNLLQKILHQIEDSDILTKNLLTEDGEYTALASSKVGSDYIIDKMYEMHFAKRPFEDDGLKTIIEGFDFFDVKDLSNFMKTIYTNSLENEYGSFDGRKEGAENDDEPFRDGIPSTEDDIEEQEQEDLQPGCPGDDQYTTKENEVEEDKEEEVNDSTEETEADDDNGLVIEGSEDVEVEEELVIPVRRV